MTTVNNSLSWVVKLVVFVAIVCVVLGVSLWQNFKAEATPAIPSTATTLTQSAPSSPSNSPAPADAHVQLAAQQALAAMFDRSLSSFQKAFQTAQQFASAITEMTERQLRYEQLRVDLRNQDRTFNQQLVIDKANADEALEWSRRLHAALLIAGSVLTLVITVGVILLFAMTARSKVIVARAHAAQITAQTSSVAAVTSAAEQKEQLKAVWHTVSDLSRKQARLERELDGMRQTATGKTSTVQVHRNYRDLPLAK